MSTLTQIFLTGANKGLGYYVSKEIVARPNIHLIVACRGSWTDEAAAKALSDIKAAAHKESKVNTIDGLDLTNDESIENVVKKLSSITNNSLDILVNNAAVFSFFTDKDLPTRKMWLKDFQTNVFGPVILTDLVIPLLKKSNKKPRIFNVSSDLGSMTLRSDPTWRAYGFPTSSYPSSKAALNSHTVYLSVIHKDITSVSWQPGYTATPLNNFTGPAKPEEVAKDYVAGIFDQNVKSGTFFDSDGIIPW